MGPSGSGSTDFWPAPSQRDFAITAREDGAQALLPSFWLGRSAIPGPPCYGAVQLHQPPQRAQRAGAQCLENFTPFFKGIAENQGKALACFWHSFEWNWYFGGMAICRELTPRQAAVWSSDVLSLMEIKPCWRLNYQVKPFQKTN